MLLIIAVFAFVAAAILLIFLVLRQGKPSFDHTQSYTPPPPETSLFEPTRDELRAIELEDNAALAAGTEVARAIEHTRQVEGMNARLSTWALSPNKHDTIELIHLSVASGDDAVFGRVASETLRVFRENGIDGLAADDLAALLDSHQRLLSEREGHAGELFWLREEIAKLRSQR